MKANKFISLLTRSAAGFILMSCALLMGAVHAHAATITVNSKADTAATDAECTLREAIINANDDADNTGGDCAAGSGTDTIEFGITGSADYTSGGENGYTIPLTSALPTVTTPIIVNGYSQPNASPNTAVSPLPMNGKLLIEIDGEALSQGWDCFNVNGSDGFTLTGLVVNRCGGNGLNMLNVANTTIQGNYIGVDPDGVTRKANGRDIVGPFAVGSGLYVKVSATLLIGGTDPADRNVIAGNQYGEVYLDSDYQGSDVNEPMTNTNTTIQGNYFGLGADGTTVLPCGGGIGVGNSLLLTHNSGDLIGGSATGATNVIAASTEYGISYRDGSRNNVIQGNYIGTDYTGNTIADHPSWSPICDPGPGNPCGSAGHPWSGISIATISVVFNLAPFNITIGGTGAGEGNVIGGNRYYDNPPGNQTPGITVHDGAHDVTIQGNKVGVGADGSTAIGNAGYGVVITNSDPNPPSAVENILIGGTSAAAANLIHNNDLAGIGAFDGVRFSVLRNSIYNNGGLGIALNNGVVNDVGDVDSGTNDLLNYPEYTNITESSGNSTVSFRMDVPAGDYRVEFFSNTSPDSSGYGEGETYLGYADVVSSGTGSENFTTTLTGVTGITNLALTATERNVATPSGFGVTSGFGPNTEQPGISDLAATKTLLNPQDVAVGATLSYEITITNTGPDAFELSDYDLSNPGFNQLIADIMSPDLTYLSNQGADFTCFSAGPGSAVLFGSVAANHSDYEVVLCGWTAGAQSLAVGDSVSMTLNVQVTPSSDLVFENIASVASVTTDPDYETVGIAAGTGQDIFDLLEGQTNSFAYARYPLPAEISPDNSNDSSLADTGDSEFVWWAVVGMFVLVPSWWMAIRRKLERSAYKK